MPLPFPILLFLCIGLTGTIIQSIRLLKLHTKNRNNINYVNDLSKYILNAGTIDLAMLDQDLNFLLRTFNCGLSITELYRKLNGQLESGPAFSLILFKLLHEQSVLVLGSFISSEVYRGRSGNDACPRLLPCIVVFRKIASEKIGAFGIYPQDKYHDIRYADLFSKINEMIRT